MTIKEGMNMTHVALMNENIYKTYEEDIEGVLYEEYECIEDEETTLIIVAEDDVITEVIEDDERIYDRR